MDKSLDDIIQTQPRRGRGRGMRGSGFGRRGYGRPIAVRAGAGGASFTRPGRIPDGQWQHDGFNGDGGVSIRRMGGGGGSVAQSTAKLLVSNLDFNVSDSDIQELFAEFGPLRKASVHYDQSGRSLGSADVIFERRSDATTAMRQYNNVPLDGRAMKIEMVGPSARMEGRVEGRRGGFRGGAMSGPTRGNRFGRGRGGRGGRGRKSEPTPTVDDLDAELDAYVNKMDSA